MEEGEGTEQAERSKAEAKRAALRSGSDRHDGLSTSDLTCEHNEQVTPYESFIGEAAGDQPGAKQDFESRSGDCEVIPVISTTRNHVAGDVASTSTEIRTTQMLTKSSVQQQAESEAIPKSIPHMPEQAKGSKAEAKPVALRSSHGKHESSSAPDIIAGKFPRMDGFHSLVVKESSVQQYSGSEVIPFTVRDLPDRIQLTDSICFFPRKRISEQVFKGQRTSALWGVRPIAVKMKYSDENTLREIEILNELGVHQNIVFCIEIGSYFPGEMIYLAMELCHKQNLQQHTEKRKKAGEPFDNKVAIQHAKQVVAGLTHIHKSRIVHCDLKPDNILFSLDKKNLKISDFGLSRKLDRQSTLFSFTGHSDIDGYRAPELITTGKFSEKADIFSLGSVLHYICSYGEHPYGSDPQECNYHVKKNLKPDFSTLELGFGAEARNLLAWMLQFEPEDRPSIQQVENNEMLGGPNKAPRYGSSDSATLRGVEFQTIDDQSDQPKNKPDQYEVHWTTNARISNFEDESFFSEKLVPSTTFNVADSSLVQRSDFSEEKKYPAVASSDSELKVKKIDSMFHKFYQEGDDHFSQDFLLRLLSMFMEMRYFDEMVVEGGPSRGTQTVPTYSPYELPENALYAELASTWQPKGVLNYSAKSLSSGKVISATFKETSAILKGIEPGDEYSVTVYEIIEGLPDLLVAQSAIQTRKTIRREGGIITVGGCVLKFPNNAIRDKADIEVCSNLEDAPYLSDEHFRITPVFDFRSTQKIFEERVTCILTAPYINIPKSTKVAILCYENQKWQKVCSSFLKMNKTIEFKCDHFSPYVVVLEMSYEDIRAQDLSIQMENRIYYDKDHNFTGVTCLDDPSIIGKCDTRLREHGYSLSGFVLTHIEMKVMETVNYMMRRLQPTREINEWEVTLDEEFVKNWYCTELFCMNKLSKKTQNVKLQLERTHRQKKKKFSINHGIVRPASSPTSIVAMNLLQGRARATFKQEGGERIVGAQLQ